MNFDDILAQIGGFGKFQKILYVWICLPQILLAFHMLVSVFTGAVPPHLCRSEWPSNQAALSFNSSVASGGPGADLACSAPGPSRGSPPLQLNHSDASALMDRHASAGCQAGWEFSDEIFHSTVATEVSR